MLLFIGFISDPERNIDAFGSFCLQHGSSGRPLAGYIVYNEVKLNPVEQDLEKGISITSHELMHVIAFNLKLFPFYPINGGKPIIAKEGGKYYLSSKIFVQVAKEHFGCPTITRLALEDEGGEGIAGNHFETNLFGNEIMIGSAKRGYKLSVFSLALLADSGW